MSEPRPSFAAAVLPDRWRCAGQPLAPHTLGHALLLQRLGSPYAGRPPAAGSPPAALGDTLLAWRLCARPWRVALATLDTVADVLWLHWQGWRRAAAAVRLHAELTAYLHAAWPVVELWESAEPKRTLGADPLHLLLLTQRRLGLGLQAALDVPLALACWDQLAEGERSGVIRIRTDYDDAVSAELDRLLASGVLPQPGMERDPNGGWRWPAGTGPVTRHPSPATPT